MSSAFFPQGESDPRVAFDVRIRPSPEVASITLAVGGKEVEYHNGPESWTRLEWPGAEPAAGARLDVRGAHGLHERLRQEGEWGLFRLLEAAEVGGERGARTFRATWRLRGRGVEVTIDVRPVRSDTPFFGRGSGRGNRLLSPVRAPGVRVPRNIAAGAADCRVRS